MTQIGNSPRKGGPKTEEGKRKSSLNALKHGLSAKSTHALQAVVEQTGVDYELTLDKVRSTFWPVDYVEDELAKRIALCLWRLAVMQAMEVRLLGKKAERFRPGASYEAVLKSERIVSLELHRCIRTLTTKRGSQQTSDIGLNAYPPDTSDSA